MADSSLMVPDTTNYSSLLSNGVVYKVPPFQRDYSWNEDNWTDLWEDLSTLLKEKKDHYMGAVVLQRAKKNKKEFIIIDGQQRFTTLSLLALAIIKRINSLVQSNIDLENNKQRIEELKRSFLGHKDPASLMLSSKLFLNENNDDFYQAHLLPLKPPREEKKIFGSDRLLWKGFNFFYEKIEKEFSKYSGEKLANFLSNYIGDKIIFIKIVVEDELSAYTLFETLNYRGVDLTVTDLLKNYLFSLLSKNDLKTAINLWKQISETVEIKKFPSFLRHFWLSRHPFVREEKLFKVIRSKINNNEDVFELLYDLESNAEIYIALQDPNDSIWNGGEERDKKRKKHITELKVFKVKQQLPLLLIAKEKFTNEEFDKTLKVISILSFRYNVIGRRQANKMEELYNKVSQKIFNKKISTAEQVFNDLKELYIPDVDFKNDLSTFSSSHYGQTKKIMRYILFELENNFMQGGDRDFETDPATIEHILPKNDTTNFENNFSLSKHQEYVDRLGNCTLLEDHINRNCSTLSIEEKKEHYSKSQYAITRTIHEKYGDWKPATIDARQNDFAKRATSIWCITYANKKS